MKGVVFVGEMVNMHLSRQNPTICILPVRWSLAL